MDSSYLFRSLVFGAIFLILTIYAMRKSFAFSIQKILLIGFFCRIITIVVFISSTSYDTLSYKMIGERVLRGASIYPDLAYYHHPYFPFLLYFEALDVYLSQHGIPFTLVLKLFFSGFDLIAIYFIYKLSNAKNALLYAVNPSMIFLSAAHGQIEAIPFAFILAAIYYAIHKRSKLSAIMLSCAVLIKTWPALLISVFIRTSRTYYAYVLALCIPLFAVIYYVYLFHANFLEVLRPVASYRGIYGYYGLGIFISYIFPQIQGQQLAYIKIISSVSIALLFFYSFFIKQKNLIKACFQYVLLVCLLVISGANPLWLLPFIILIRPRLWKPWIILIGIQSIIEIPIIQLNAQQNIFYGVISQTSLALGMGLYLIEVYMYYFIKKRSSSTPFLALYF